MTYKAWNIYYLPFKEKVSDPYLQHSVQKEEARKYPGKNKSFDVDFKHNLTA